MKDAYAREYSCITEEKPRSVLSGKTIEELAHAEESP